MEDDCSLILIANFVHRKSSSYPKSLLFAFTVDDAFERVIAIPSQLYTSALTQALETQLKKLPNRARVGKTTSPTAAAVQVSVRTESGFHLISLMVSKEESLERAVEHYLVVSRLLAKFRWKVATGVAPFGTKVDGVLFQREESDRCVIVQGTNALQ